jgi:signal transduction histidine kinase
MPTVFSSSRSIRTQLSLLVAGALIPMLLIGIALTWQLTEVHRKDVRESLGDTANAVAIAVDRQLTGYAQVLRSVAETDAFQNADMAAFHALASRVAVVNGALFISVFDEEGRQILNTALPYGSPLPQPLFQRRMPGKSDALPTGEVDSIRRSLQTKAPAYSGIFRSLSTGRIIFTVNIPVARGGRNFILNAGFPVEMVSHLLSQHEEFSRRPVGIIDGRGISVARTAEVLPKTGTRSRFMPAPSGLPKRGTGSVFENDETQQLDYAYERSAVGDWIAMVAVDRATEAASERKILLTGAGWVLGGALFAIILAGAMAARFRRAVHNLVSVARGSPPQGTSIRELAQVELALSDLASARMNEAAEREQRLLADARKQQVEEENRLKDEFLAMLSHELRNPLAALTTAAHVLRAAAPDDVATAGAQSVIERQTAHMVRLIEDLLDVTRVRLGKLSLKQEPVNLADLISEITHARRTAGALEGQATVSLDLRPVWISADRARLEQVYSNLLGNALKFTPADGAIQVSLRQEGRYGVLRVADTGRGIDADILPTLFEPFVQGEQKLDRSEGGLGLGLALVKRLTELHGGSVTAENRKEGSGTTFTVTLPAIAAPQTPRLAVPSAQEFELRPLRMLIVEDNDDARRMLRVMLTMDGHEVHEAANGTAGLKAAADTAPDVVLLDIGLPDLDGYEVARRLRAAANGHRLALIALSGYGQEEDLDRARAAGFDAHLAKPATPERLRQTVASLVN